MMLWSQARAAVTQMRLFAARPHLQAGLAAGHLSDSWAGEIIRWTRPLPAQLRGATVLCQFHHDVCIHRWNWQIVLHPDGTTTATGPDGQVLHSHSPPTARAA